MALRKISHELPQQIYEGSNERYYDIETRHTVATMSVEIHGKLREVMVAYDIEEQTVRLLTIHPLKESQKENRLKSGRWRRVE
ncbi:hypothetical protein ACFL0Q_00805 [Thermodesulfobacteriota bacterium]